VLLKAFKISCVAFLIGINLFFAVMALQPEENTEPVISYLTPQENKPAADPEKTPASNPEDKTTSKGNNKPGKTLKPSKKEESSTPEPVLKPLSVNINTASAEEFSQIDGITPKLAETIVLFRDMAGGFTGTEDLMKVKGMTKEIFDKIETYIYCK